MSFSINQSVSVKKLYPTLGGLVAIVDDETVTVEYSAIYLESFVEGIASVKYSMSIPGVDAIGYGYTSFIWDGSGDPLAASEINLKENIEKPRLQL